MNARVMQNSGKGQFALSSIFLVVTFACVLFAMIAQRSPLGVIAWSLVGVGYSWFVRFLYLRRSLLCLFSGTCILALGWLQGFGWSSVLIGLAGGLLAIIGGFTAFANVAERRPPVDRHNTAGEPGAMDGLIARRALTFAKTLKWVNPRITATGPAPPDIIARFGAPESADYCEIRIEMDRSDDHKSKLLADCDSAQRNDLRTRIDAPIELLVVCSRNDVIYHEIANTEVD